MSEMDIIERVGLGRIQKVKIGIIILIGIVILLFGDNPFAV